MPCGSGGNGTETHKFTDTKCSVVAKRRHRTDRTAFDAVGACIHQCIISKPTETSICFYRKAGKLSPFRLRAQKTGDCFITVTVLEFL